MGGTACRAASAGKEIERMAWQKLLPGRTSVRLALVSLLQVSLQMTPRQPALRCKAHACWIGQSENQPQIVLGTKDSDVNIPFIPIKTFSTSSPIVDPGLNPNSGFDHLFPDPDSPFPIPYF